MFQSTYDCSHDVDLGSVLTEPIFWCVNVNVVDSIS